MSFTFACLAAVAIDGDTIRCSNVPEAKGRVRLARVDTPERGKPGYAEATAFLAARLIAPVRCAWVDADPRKPDFQWHDRFGRRVAFCYSKGLDLGAASRRAGFAKTWP